MSNEEEELSHIVSEVRIPAIRQNSGLLLLPHALGGLHEGIIDPICTLGGGLDVDQAVVVGKCLRLRARDDPLRDHVRLVAHESDADVGIRKLPCLL